MWWTTWHKAEIATCKRDLWSRQVRHLFVGRVKFCCIHNVIFSERSRFMRKQLTWSLYTLRHNCHRHAMVVVNQLISKPSYSMIATCDPIEYELDKCYVYSYEMSTSWRIRKFFPYLSFHAWYSSPSLVPRLLAICLALILRKPVWNTNIYTGNIFPSLNPAKIFQFISRWIESTKSSAVGPNHTLSD